MVMTRDSVSGIPYQMPVSCDSCRRSIPRTRVDSIRLVDKTPARNVAEFVGILAAAVIADGVVCYLLDRGDPQC